jgi:hypothetical protein
MNICTAHGSIVSLQSASQRFAPMARFIIIEEIL